MRETFSNYKNGENLYQAILNIRHLVSLYKAKKTKSSVLIFNTKEGYYITKKCKRYQEITVVYFFFYFTEQNENQPKRK